MAEMQAHKASVGGKVDPERVVARLARLRQAHARADGNKKAELEQAIAQYEAQMDRLKAVVNGTDTQG